MSLPAQDNPLLDPVAGLRLGNVFAIELDLSEDCDPFTTLSLLFDLHVNNET